MITVWTVGHGALNAQELGALLRRAEVEVLVDVRRFPGSRRHPQFGGAAMRSWLPDHGVGYRWLEDLGGRRAPASASPNVALPDDQVRGYADHMATPGFAAAVADLRADARERNVAVMCAESSWRNCHRRLLADHLVLVSGDRVEHLRHDGGVDAHVATPEARVGGPHLVYDVGTQRSLLADP